MRAIQKLHGKTALITGRQGGVCIAIARRLANEGAYVFTMHPGDSKFAMEIQGIGKSVTWLQGDGFNPDDLRRLFKQIREKRGKIDIVVVTSSAPDDYVPLSEITQEHYEAVFGHPVKGILFTIEKALPLLSDGASIILNTAIASETQLAGNSLHSATLEAVLSFGRALTKQCGRSLDSRERGEFRNSGCPARHRKNRATGIVAFGPST
jgi:NAD(P)-dependent dehydrogenase (short-subunit alcohol dehydrogenase family)